MQLYYHIDTPPSDTFFEKDWGRNQYEKNNARKNSLRKCAGLTAMALQCKQKHTSARAECRGMSGIGTPETLYIGDRDRTRQHIDGSSAQSNRTEQTQATV